MFSAVGIAFLQVGEDVKNAAQMMLASEKMLAGNVRYPCNVIARCEAGIARLKG